jgi:neutral amino acid transport system substrate-binding protein
LAEVDKVTEVVGVFTSSVSSAAVTIAAQNNVMLVFPSSTSSVLIEQAKTSNFQS